MFAAAEGEVVAAHIAAAALGREAAERFDGRGFCYIETGAGRAAKGVGSFFDLPHPVMGSDPPDETQYRDKLASLRPRGPPSPLLRLAQRLWACPPSPTKAATTVTLSCPPFSLARSIRRLQAVVGSAAL